MSTAPTPQAQLVLCTVPSEEVASTLARSLLEERLVACVNVIPGVRSLYRWQGAIEDERELLLVMKTERARYPALEARIRALHPYEVCEVLAVDIAAGVRAVPGLAERRPAWLARGLRAGP